jgi:hypothetical protein
MIKIKTYSLSIAAGAVDTLIGTLSVPDAHTYSVLEIGITVPANTTLRGYIVDEKTIEVAASGVTDTRRRVLNWAVAGGNDMRFYGSNSGGAAAVVGLELVYDDVAA